MENLVPLLTRFLTTTEVAQVAALFDAILPPDPDTGCPGARAVGAPDFLQRLLALDESQVHDVPRWRSMYRAGLAGLDHVSRARDLGPLAELNVDAASALLTDLAANRVTGLPPTIDQKAWFGILRDHCIQGCFADPRWGGNRDGAMWKWFGYLNEVH
jgi:hypothetical protein